MLRLTILLLIGSLGLSACTTTTQQVTLGADGKPLPRLYRINSSSEGRIQYRMLDSVNALRQASGAQPVTLNATLTAAAATHSRDMSLQNRPWHFGSDGSSPLDRLRRVGYQGRLMGENISETYETELETLSAWMEQDDTRRVILDPAGTEMGIAWHQEANGKIWWTLVMGAPNLAPIPQG
ncbi:CAP domain-containing protein [Thalassovita sp.]|uniref:CAP domain-containing protein n=1 Tax=Thalassovita sp. TaxID=1979401 RepID=UPI0028815668|nr:CAP domain-containing protein [Thalassovita sp.]MDF1802214.1 CAP domain-containing protein [Thalassovita sp.]